MTKQLSWIGCIRRIQGLGAEGYPIQEIAAHLGMSENQLLDTMATMGFTGEAGETLRRIYENPPKTMRHDRQVKEANLAKGWVPPIGWECLEIDNPETTPDFGVPERRTEQEVLEEYRFLTVTESPYQAAKALGVELKHIERIIREEESKKGAPDKAERTTCKYNHELTPENTRLSHRRRRNGKPVTYKACVTCERIRNATRRRNRSRVESAA